MRIGKMLAWVALAVGGCKAVVYAPAVPNAAPAAAAAEVPASARGSCGRGEAAVSLNAQEAELGRMLESAPGQQHARLTLNPILARVARERARDLAARNYFSHVDPDGLGANTFATRAGYRLPDVYDRRPSGNNIESLGSGYATAARAWSAWMHSTPHRTHLLGLQPFYREQTEYGIGYAFSPRSTYQHYWVVLIAKPAC